MSESKNTYLL